MGSRMGILDSTVEIAKSGLKKAEELATGASNLVSNTVSEQYAALTKSKVVKEVNSVTSDLARLSIAFNEPATTAKLTQQGEHVWQTVDKKLTVEHVDAVCGKNTS
jgi:hypothetical protein